MPEEMLKDQDMMELAPGERLEVLLNELRLTQTALADMTSVSPQYVNNIVRRGQRITEDFARELNDAVDVNLNWLFTGDGAMLQMKHTVNELPENYETVVTVEDQLNNAADHLRAAADELAKARRSESCDHD